MDTSYTDRHWQSADGLTLHFREYGSAGNRPPVICLHGLTRNARDFEDLAPHIAGQGWRVLVPSMRGRGDSDYAEDPESYQVGTYMLDVLALLDTEEIDSFVSIGTSMGGLITLALAAVHPDRIKGAVLNDVGPLLETAGLDAIKTYVGQGRSFPTWMHAARALEEVHGDAFPDYGTEEWIAMAKRLYRLNSGGRIVLDYDMKIAEPIRAMGSETGVDMWPVMPAFGGIPTLLLRGARSDLLSADNALRMARDIGESAELVTVPDVGHAPVRIVEH